VRWVIELVVESTDPDHMTELMALTAQYLRAAMDHTRRHDARLVEVWLRKEVPFAADDSASERRPGA